VAEILNFKTGARIIKLNTVVTYLSVQGILMFHCERDKNTENIPLNWLNVLWGQAECHLKNFQRANTQCRELMQSTNRLQLSAFFVNKRRACVLASG
jgi:hypothetical protein